MNSLGKSVAKALTGSPVSIRAIAREAKLSHVTLLAVTKTKECTEQVGERVMKVMALYAARMMNAAGDIERSL